jgi:hypothetical protein
MNPPTTGPITGPRNGPMVYITIGQETCSFTHMSVIDPPATERNADPENPVENRETRIVAIFWATAVGTCQTKVSTPRSEVYERRRNTRRYKLVFVHRIQTLDQETLSLATLLEDIHGPIASPSTKVDNPRIATTLETWNSSSNCL